MTNSNPSNDVSRFDHLLKDDRFGDDASSIAAITIRQWLEPVEGKQAVIFPPTYAVDSGSLYNIDYFDRENDKLDNVCQIDSVGSQANRIEPIFTRTPYRLLVPQVSVKHNSGEVNLLTDAGHRAADAIVRFSDLWKRFHPAFDAYKNTRNAELLARIAPTSIVFGSWDSRATQAKLPRVVRSVIRAYRVKEMTRSAQYTTVAGEIMTDGDAIVDKKGTTKESVLGLAHVPAVRTHGGVIVLGEIRREAILNLVVLRSLAAAAAVTKPDTKDAGSDDTKEPTRKSDEQQKEDDLKLRRYILGLSLVSLVTAHDPFLREGCMLVPDAERELECKFVRHDGRREDTTIDASEVLTYAQDAAEAFLGTREPGSIEGTFDSAAANRILQIGDKKKRQDALRKDPNANDSSDEESQKKEAKKKSSKKKAAS